MTIGTKSLIGCVNTKIADAETPIEILQLASVARDFDQGFVKSVANCAALPPAADNEGRLIYLEDRCSYRWSDGLEWTNDFTSVKVSAAYGWGSNTNGRLGDNTVTNRSSPVSFIGGITDWCELKAGRTHSLGVRASGTLWAWGNNSDGQLGDNTIISKNSPVSVIGGFTDWCQVSAGEAHSLGLRSGGTLWSWGRNSYGRLGDGTTVSRSSPVSIVGGFTDWCQASAGRFHNLAVRSNGTLWAWGSNGTGRLGDNTAISKLSPVSVVGGFADWRQASAGNRHSLGVRSNGTLWAWGCGSAGQLGTNNLIDSSSPVSVIGGFTDWCQASAGFYHSLGVRSNGTLWSWGDGSNGKLGTNSTVARSSPVTVVGGFTNWCQASAGCEHNLGVRSNGTLWAWGCNNLGQLGDNTAVNKSSPVSVVGGFTDWCQASAGGEHSLGIFSRGF